MFRFYVEKKNQDSFILSDETLKHIKVARTTNEKFICVYKGLFYICKLENKKAKIISELRENHEFNGEVILAASLINIKKFELLVQKATELGATKLIPVVSENMAVKIPFDITKKISRWNEIAKNAAEQSFRNKKIIIEYPMKFDDVLELKVANKYIAHEKKCAKVNESYEQNSLFLIGPEGGFTDEEVFKANKKSFEIISLGKRILRAETASIFVLSKIKQ